MRVQHFIIYYHMNIAVLVLASGRQGVPLYKVYRKKNFLLSRTCSRDVRFALSLGFLNAKNKKSKIHFQEVYGGNAMRDGIW